MKEKLTISLEPNASQILTNLSSHSGLSKSRFIEECIYTAYELMEMHDKLKEVMQEHVANLSEREGQLLNMTIIEAISRMHRRLGIANWQKD